MLNIKEHWAGFFSSCSMILDGIVKYCKINNKIPDGIDTTNTFLWYKNQNKGDIRFEYFKNDILLDISFNNLNIEYHHDYQYEIYKNLNYNEISPYIKKYFSLNENILNIVEEIENKYNLNNYNNICCLFYRGNDKNREVQICSYEDIAERAAKYLEKNPSARFLLQSDEKEFLDFFTTKFPNSFYLNDYIRVINKSDTTVDIVYKNLNNLYSKYYLAITYIMSKCNYIIMPSGNCSVWILYYRENCKNVEQYLNGIWYES